ncbi:MAG: rhodanese-like domain-containing protein [Candidatus Pacearchaeota archaeon]|nr:rhodanese-like domain-containing protein [Candidatus Pacearchaeota archaeon]
MSVENIHANELRNLIKNHKDEIDIVDIREPSETNIIKIKGSKLIPMNELQKRLDEIDWNKKVIFLCRSGSRSGMITNMLSNIGKDVSNLQYGIAECYFKGKGENLVIDKENIDRYF